MHLACVSNQIHCVEWPHGGVVRTYAPVPTSPMQIRSASWANKAGWMCVVTCHGQVEVVSFKCAPTKFLHRIEGIRDARCGAFHNLNKRDIAIAQGDSVLIYDVKRGYVKRALGPSSDRSEYFKVLVGAKDEYVCAAARGNRVDVFDRCGAAATFEAAHAGALVNVAVDDRRGLKVAACTDRGACVLWELAGATNVYSEPTKCAIRDLAMRDDCILYVTEGGQCVLRDCCNAATIGRFDLRYTPKCVDVCADGVSFAVCDERDTIYGYDVRNLASPTARFQQLEGAGIVQIAFCKHETLGCQEDDIRVVHEYDSLMDARTDSSRYSADLDFGSVSEMRANAPPADDDDAVAPVAVGVSFEVAELVRAAVRDGIDEVKMEIKAQMQRAVVDATKSNFFELRMALVKEFIKIQEILDKLQQGKNAAKDDLT